MSLELTCSIEEFVERIVTERLEELTERLDTQDVELAKLRAEIAALRPKQIARRGHDVDSAQVELR
ncbi:MAG TPA: hypothetical protein VNE63_08585 [Candidatus Acidoferrales bacterium]|nr:hypothetical protein [Candidatus Acidoferrales bacterium]